MIEQPPPSDTVAVGRDRPPSFGRRALAKLTDVLVVNVVSTALFCAYAGLQAGGLSPVGLIPWLVAPFLVFSWLYFAVGTSGGRQTPGYRLAGLRVVRTAGDAAPVGLGRALGRSLIDWLAWTAAWYGVVGLLDYLPVAATPAKRALHDLATGTRVVAVGPPRTAALGVCAALFVGFPVGMVFGVVRPFLMQSFYMPSPAMTPTLPVDSHFVVDKLCYLRHGPRRGDIVAFRAPASAAASLPSGADTDYVKRVVGLPGEDLRMAGGKVLIFGRGALQEPYILAGYARDLPRPGSTDDQDDWFAHRRSSLVRHGGAWWIRVPPDAYFVLGDDRNDSNDSHVWGFLPRADIRGRATFEFSPRLRDL